MAFDLATAKTRHGILGTAQDAAILAAIEASWEVAEDYCSRGLRYQAGVVETKLRYNGDSVRLYRYPIVAITSVVDTTAARTYAATEYEVDAPGVIYFNAGDAATTRLTITYDAGYATLPAALEEAMWAIFDVLWAAWGIPNNSSAELSSVTMEDIGTIRFVTPPTSASTSTSVDDLIGGRATALLDAYRDIQC